MPHTKKRCSCRICQSKLAPIDARIVAKHLKYGSNEPTTSPEKNELEEFTRFSSDGSDMEETPESQVFVNNTETSDQKQLNNVTGNSEQAVESLQESDESITSNEEDQGSLSDVGSDSSETDDEGCDEKKKWSFSFDSELYSKGIATQNLPDSNITILQWLAINFYTFSSHAMSKSTFSSHLNISFLQGHLDDLMGDCPTISPVTISSQKRKQPEASSQDEDDDEIVDQDQDSSSSEASIPKEASRKKVKKSKSSEVMDLLKLHTQQQQEFRKEEAARKDKMHKEKMALLSTLVQSLQQKK
ncbi:dentin sialophosphoprotein-like [Ylistrum balloti]|uniref:dentin sialophosphoprotein-like n=1 Tax=Ylistrum balloti TaxID=509963 RepID=UPI002905A25A|nr:dentin sialophosphoprotein-like [Ylistrum balloti]